jgi:polar amino acid transport system substrate-binding protein
MIKLDRRLVTACFIASILSGLLAFAPFAPASAASLAEIKQRGEVRIVTTSSSPPHGFLDPSVNKLRGIMFEVGEAVAKDLGVKAKYTEVPFGSLIPELTSGRADLMSAPLFITPQRAEVLDFSAPVYGWGEGLIVKESSAKTYTDLGSMKGDTVGVFVNSVQYNMIKETPGVKEVRAYPDYIHLMADIRAGRADVGVIDPPSVVYQMKLHNVSGLKLVPSYKPVNQWKIGLAVKKGDKDVLDAVNAAVAKIKKDGELKRILTEWGIPETIAE